MTLILNTTPVKTVNGIDSRPAAALTQLPQTFAREDFSAYRVRQGADNGAGGLYSQYILTIADNPTMTAESFGVGDSAYCALRPAPPTLNSYPGGLFTVIRFYESTPDVEFALEVSEVYSVNQSAPGYANNLTARPNYKVNIQLREGVQANDGPALLDTVFNFAPRPDGTLFVDLGPVLSQYLVLNYIPLQQYYFEFWESWTDSGAIVPQLSNDQTAVVSKLDPFGGYGSNMFEYLLRNDGTATEAGRAFSDVGIGGTEPEWAFLSVGSGGVALFPTGSIVMFSTEDGVYNNQIGYIAGAGSSSITVFLPYPAVAAGAGTVYAYRAKLLTRFENPLMWRGWYRAVSMIYDANIKLRNGNEQDVRLMQYPANINKVRSGALIRSDALNVEPPQIRTQELWPSTGYFMEVYASKLDSSVPLSETLYYQMLDECKNPVCVRWVNSLGAPDEHIFSISQIFKTSTSDGTTTNSPTNYDLYEGVAPPGNRSKWRLDVDSVQTMVLTAENLTLDQFNALQEIKSSLVVFLYLDKAGTEFLPVVVSDNYDTEHDTNAGNFTFNLTLELPDGVDFYRAKKY